MTSTDQPQTGVYISASSTIKTGRHDIAEALLKVALNTQKNQLRRHFEVTHCTHIVPKNV
jgi:hypothetical protein